MVQFVILTDEYGAKTAVNPDLVASVDEFGKLERVRNANEDITGETFVPTPGVFDLRLSGVKEVLCLLTVRFDGTLQQLVDYITNPPQ